MYDTLLGLLMMIAGCFIIYVSLWYHDIMDDINRNLEEDIRQRVNELVEEKKREDNSQKFDIEN